MKYEVPISNNKETY